MVCIAAIGFLGTSIDEKFDDVGNEINDAGAPAPAPAP